MLDGHLLVDAHIHAARLSTLRPAWTNWAHSFGSEEVTLGLYDDADAINPARFDAYLADEGVDVAMLFCEYSPKATGIQPIEDLLPIRMQNLERLRVVANINPHVHYPVDEELQRQVDLGAIALKVHPVHAGIAPNDNALYPAYALCESLGLPLIVHCGTSSFPGSRNSFADPLLLDEVLRDFRRLNVLLAHGGRGWWYDAAAFMALSNEHVYIELSGLPPSRLNDYYAKHNWGRLTQRMVFGTDWPGVPGIAKNAREIADLCPDEATVARVLAGNASELFHLGLSS
jgi:predicted TIM-barrel fold metal-dependent hydrolase